jgi:imidazolonepropionase-like amidohydrolase
MTFVINPSSRSTPRTRPASGAPQGRAGPWAAALLLLALALAWPPSLYGQDGQGPLYLTGGRVVDVAAGDVEADVTVVVQEERIRDIVPDDSLGAIPDEATVVRLEGRYVLPGLIDGHTHLETLGAARRALESGVTTARAVGVGGYRDVRMRQMVREGTLPGPEMVAAGVFVDTDLGEAVLADPRLGAFHGEDVRRPADLRRVVQVNIDRGVDWIKTRATERAGLPDQDPRQQVYGEDQLRAIVEAGAPEEVPVAVHAHGDAGIRAAVAAGARSIEHGTYASAETLSRMASAGTYLVPTMAVVEDLTRPGGDYDDPYLQIRGTHMLPRLRTTVRQAHSRDVAIVAGVDTGYGPESVIRIGHELEQLVGAGLSPPEALRAATTTAAQMLRIEDRTGRVAEGLEADLIVVDRNPLEDVTNVQDVLVVVSNGRLALNRLPFARTD